MNTLNKLLLGASIVGSVYLSGCMRSMKTTDSTHTVTDDGLVTIEKDSTKKILSVKTGDIQLDSNKISWNNAKLINKDDGFISYSWGERGIDYVYNACLFRNPVGEEITLFGQEGVLFVGENYNIEFYKLKPNQTITSDMIISALEKDSFSIFYNKNVTGLEGLLNSYVRVTNARVTK